MSQGKISLLCSAAINMMIWWLLSSRICRVEIDKAHDEYVSQTSSFFSYRQNVLIQTIQPPLCSIESFDTMMGAKIPQSASKQCISSLSTFRRTSSNQRSCLSIGSLYYWCIVNIVLHFIHRQRTMIPFPQCTPCLLCWSRNKYEKMDYWELTLASKTAKVGQTSWK